MPNTASSTPELPHNKPGHSGKKCGAAAAKKIKAGKVTPDQVGDAYKFHRDVIKDGKDFKKGYADNA